MAEVWRDLPYLENGRNPQGLAVWMDDVRPMPDGYDLWITNGEAFCELLRHNHIRSASLDHDMGPGLDGTAVVKLIVELAQSALISPIRFAVHTGNPVAGNRMVIDLQRVYRRYWTDTHWPLHYTPAD